MPLIDLRKLKRTYLVNSVCKNCGNKEEIKVPKGRTMREFLNSNEAVCSNCGCALMRNASLEDNAFSDDSKADEFIQILLENMKEDLAKLKDIEIARGKAISGGVMLRKYMRTIISFLKK